MIRFVASVVVVSASLAAGSWVGLGMPDGAQTRAVARNFEATLTPHVRSSRVAMVAKGEDRPAPPPGDVAQSPTVDTTALTALAPYPQLNPDASVTRAWLLAEGPSRDLHPRKKYVTLTFDDGPNPTTTPSILDLLDRHHVPATFFFVGRYLGGDDRRARRSRDIAHDVVARGHAIGNHTRDHAILGRLDAKDVVREIEDGAFAIESATGRGTSFFRPPYGSLDASGEREAKRRGLELVLWSIEVDDMRRSDVATMVDELETQLEYAGGGTVLLHDFKPTSVRVLDKLLVWLDAHAYRESNPETPGYVVVDLPTYLRETAQNPQPYANRRELEKARGLAWKHEKQSGRTTSPDRDPASSRM